MLRDLGGSLLFGVPLVYTMEVWWIGQTSQTGVIAVMVLVGALVASLLRFAVIPDLGGPGALLAGARCAAMSVLVATLFALCIGVLSPGDGIAKWFGTASALGVPLAFGAALGSVLFRQAGRDGEPDDEASSGDGGGGTIDDSTPVRDMSAAVLGALFLALPIAPTDEVPLTASMLDPVRVALVVPVALLTCYVILFATGFLEHRGRQHRGFLATASVVTTTTAIAFLVVTALLLAFGQIDSATPPEWLIRQVAALAPPAVIGAAAGRLAAA
ncbi:MAG: hypothetical protein JWM86_2415 [Thermoleophilia bacterium]|nr:hypothetical protein [Thermoleophilia bacterium]